MLQSFYYVAHINGGVLMYCGTDCYVYNVQVNDCKHKSQPLLTKLGVNKAANTDIEKFNVSVCLTYSITGTDFV